MYIHKWFEVMIMACQATQMLNRVYTREIAALTLTPLVDEQGWWLSVSWLDPGREQTSLVSLVPQVLVQVRISDLLQGLNVMHRDQVTG